MEIFSIFARRLAPLIASVAMIGSCCYLYDLPPAATATPPPSPTPACHMSFTNPTSAASLSDTAAVDFSWNSVPKAAFYLLSLDVPGGVGKVLFTVHGTDRTLYMDSFQDGSFHADVQARDGDNNILCEATLQFTSAKDVKAKKKNNSPSASPVPPIILK